MKRFHLLPTWARLSAALLLILLAVVPRLVMLEHRPLMHDESLFAYYAYHYMETGQYSHIPMLHGPTLMLASGELFKRFGDTIGVGRGFVALVTLFGMAAGVALWPRRYRLGLAPLLLTSPILLFYSRFFRDDMLVATAYLLATVGFAHGLSARARLRPLWACLGAFFAIIPLAIMESALFFQAAGVTFFAVWLASKWLWRGPSLSLRARLKPESNAENAEAGRPVRGKASRRQQRKAAARGKAVAPAVAPSSADAEAAGAEDRAKPAGERPLVSWIAAVPGWAAGILLGITFVFFIYGVTYDPAQPPDANAARVYQETPERWKGLIKPLLNMKASWDYWKGQHTEHRIEGPLHYHLPILLTYELPVLLLIAAGLAWDALRRWRRAIFHGVAIWLWLWIWALWRNISYKEFWDFDPARNMHIPPPWLKPVTGFLHIQPDLSMLVLGLMITPLLAWSVLMLREHRPLAGWLGWWAACSLFQYSSAGEKVPWLALHMTLPLILTAGWVWAPLLARRGRTAHAAALAVVLAAALIGARNDYYLIGPRACDPRERLVFNHTPREFDKLCRESVQKWKALEQAGIPLKSRNVILVDAPGWPGVWYFRHCGYQLAAAAPAALAPDTDLIVGNEDLMQPLADTLDSSQWLVKRLSLRDHWLAPWPAVYVRNPGQSWLDAQREYWGTSFKAWWDYYWWRKTWTEPGGFPLIAVEPVRVRQ